ncbi:coiled-coil domain-containing protein 152 isoform X1 [Monodelphis domestica]|uniref:coiled-coil domain-containing protein 152 isoform X1 n=1 Tax=Monodelphis domestica TaxID=13616 RepID=UPI0024E1DF3C|nr:coiled-coil domain-containing protein 152 isoform X1 [Monodelphis domestica]XP_007487468.2 coiled-coil domain-containing protein 152 isoform X1 [Monodelphis domestica]
MNQTDETNVRKISMVNLDKLINDFSKIEKRMSEISSKNNKLDIQLDKTNSLLTFMQTQENSFKDEYTTLQNVINGLQKTIENQYDLKDENEQLKKSNDILKEKLKSHEQEYKRQIDKLVREIQTKEEEHKMEIRKANLDMQKKFELNEEKHKEVMEKKEMEISELTTKLRTQDMDKQNEIIKLQIEFNAQLARAQTKSAKSYPDSTVLPQNIYRRKLQHLQEEKNKEIAILRDTIRDLEHRLTVSKNFQFKRKRP